MYGNNISNVSYFSPNYICLSGECLDTWPAGGDVTENYYYNITNNTYIGANVSTKTCAGNYKVSAINNATGEVTCMEDIDTDTDTDTWNTTEEMFSVCNNNTFLKTWIPNTSEEMFSACNNGTFYSVSNPSNFISTWVPNTTEEMFGACDNNTFLKTWIPNTTQEMFSACNNNTFLKTWVPNTSAEMVIATNTSNFYQHKIAWSNLLNNPFVSSVNLTTTTCSGTNKVSAINSATGVVTCSADQTGGSSSAVQHLVAFPYLSTTMTNIGTVSKLIFATPSPELNFPVNFTGFTNFRIVYTWDYIGSGTQYLIWKNANILYSTTTTTDKFGTNTGWLDIPASFENTETIIYWYGNSSVTGDDPVAKGYSIYLR